MPLALPNGAPATVTGTLKLPAAVVAVWVPWPSASRAERYSYGKAALMSPMLAVTPAV